MTNIEINNQILSDADPDRVVGGLNPQPLPPGPPPPENFSHLSFATHFTSADSAHSNALDNPGVRKHLLDLGGEIPEPVERTPLALANLVESEIAKWKLVNKVADPEH